MDKFDDLLRELNATSKSDISDASGYGLGSTVGGVSASAARLGPRERPPSRESSGAADPAPVPRRPSRRLAREAAAAPEERPESAGGYVPSQPRRPRSRAACSDGIGAQGQTPFLTPGVPPMSIGESPASLGRPPAPPVRLPETQAANKSLSPAPPNGQRWHPGQGCADDDDDAPRRFFGPKDVGTGGYPPPQVGNPLGIEGAQELMAVVGVPELGKSWRQGLFFAGFQPYGLHQVEGGPCGVIAAVQAFLMRALGALGLSRGTLLGVTEEQRREALVNAVVEVLWTNVGDKKKAVLLAPGAGAPIGWQQLRGHAPAIFSSEGQLRAALQKRPWADTFFQPSGCGLAALLLSAVLTRGARAVAKQDADDERAAVMIGAHGYCTQELVNLLIFGRAYSNVFDGSKRIGSVDDGFCVLQGAPHRAPVGFLSLFEAYKCIEVGQRLKGPTFPVWIVCAESHYTVLFAADTGVDPRDDKADVDLYYFDQLARQSEPVRLTVRPGALPAHLETGFEDAESMIDRCIRTKWREAAVDWNGTDVIL
uniref:Deubiquitinating enzyme MINDY-3/4 conserved domain-containing protein n=1 Tax=Alexandrium monilatum TaxID=311494 RepID=A0A7S4VD22_9DINO